MLAISYYNGLFNAKGRDAVALVFPEKKYQYGAVSYEELMKFLASKKKFQTVEFDYRFEISKGYLFDFLSIPAQSAGIFPKTPYIERIPLIRDMCDKLMRKVSPLFMGWKFVVSRKE